MRKEARSLVIGGQKFKQVYPHCPACNRDVEVKFIREIQFRPGKPVFGLYRCSSCGYEYYLILEEEAPKKGSRE